MTTPNSRLFAPPPPIHHLPLPSLATTIQSYVLQHLQWTDTQPNAEPLWAYIQASICGYLFTLFRQGLLVGLSPDQAYFVRCDRTTTTQTDIDNHRVNIIVGYAPVQPSEFAILRLSLSTATTP